MMISKIWLINIALFLGVLLAGRNAYEAWTNGESRPGPAETQGKEEAVPLPAALGERIGPKATYGVVTERTLFSPDRKPLLLQEEKVPEAAEVRQVTISGSKIVLYGVVMAGEYKKALITNPLRKDNEKPTAWVKAGDTIGDLRVVDILADRVRLVEAGKKVDILLHDAGNKKAREAVAGGESSAAKPTVVVAGPEKQPEKPGVVQSRPGPAEEDGYEIVNTPFGPQKRKKK